MRDEKCDHAAVMFIPRMRVGLNSIIKAGMQRRNARIIAVMRAIMFAVLVIAGYCLLGSSAVGNVDVHLLVLAPFPDSQNPPAFNGGYSLIPAALLAVDHINQQEDILQNYTLKLIVRDSGCEQISKTVLSYIPQLTSKYRRPVAVIGPSCSESSVYLANLSDHFGIVQALFGTTPELDYHNKSLNIFGMISSTRLYAELLANLAECNKWSRISILYDSRRYFTDTLKVIRETFRGRNVTISYAGNIIQSPLTIPLTKASHQKQGTRIIVILASANIAISVACTASALNFTFPNYQFIFINRKTDDFLTNTNFTISLTQERTYICSKQNIKKGLNKAILMRFSLSAPEESTHVSGRTVGAIINEYGVKIDNICSSPLAAASLYDDGNEKLYSEKLWEYCSLTGSKIEKSIFAYPYYDATWAIAMSLNNTLIGLDGASVHRKEMLKLDFQGVSTDIYFDKETGHVTNGIDIFQVQSDEMNKITTFHRGYFVCHENLTKAFIRDIFPVHYESLDTYVLVIGITAATVSLLVTLILHIAHIVYRKYHQIKASSPLLNHFIFVGCYVMVFSVILYTIESTLSSDSHRVSSFACNFSYYLSNLSYDLIFGTLCVKLWRLYSIFKLTFEKQRLLHDRVLVLFIIGVIGINAVFHLWMVKYNMKVGSILTEVRESKDGYIQVVRRTCQFESIGYFFIPFVFHILLTVATLVLCILNRNIKFKDFRNSRSTMALVYLLTMIWTVLGTLIIIYSYESAPKNIGYLLYVGASTCTVFLCHTLIILPITIPALLQQRYQVPL